MERTVIAAARVAGFVFLGGGVLAALFGLMVTMNPFSVVQAYSPLAIGAVLLIAAAVAKRRTLGDGLLALAVGLIVTGVLQSGGGVVLFRWSPLPSALLLGGLAALAAWLVVRRAPTPSA